MVRTLVRIGALSVDHRSVPVKYFETQTARGARRYSVEIVLGETDRIILDDDSLVALEARVEGLVPATLYSRLLAGGSETAA
jgi:hypothetical protein